MIEKASVSRAKCPTSSFKPFNDFVWSASKRYSIEGVEIGVLEVIGAMLFASVDGAAIEGISGVGGEVAEGGLDAAGAARVGGEDVVEGGKTGGTSEIAFGGEFA